MKRLLFFWPLFFLLGGTLYSLTPRERALVTQARTDLVQAMTSRDAAKTEVEQAKLSVIAAESSASSADKRALEAEGKAETADRQAASDHAVVLQVNKWFGLGAFVYGIKRLFWHFLILFSVLAVATILLEIFVPWIRPILKIVFSIPVRLFELIRRKNAS